MLLSFVVFFLCVCKLKVTLQGEFQIPIHNLDYELGMRLFVIC